jgi:two-component system, NarL family, nitrate/nitrite response regulator NarL
MKVLVVDGHPPVRKTVSALLRRDDAGVEIDLASDCAEGLALATRGKAPDLVVLDLDLPGPSGDSALKAWRTRFPAIPVLVLSASNDQQTLLDAFAKGAAGFIPTASADELMRDAVRLVLDGGKYLPPQVLAPSVRARPVQPPPRKRPPPVDSLGLTDRQLDVLRHIARGAPNKIICRELGLAERTVKAHVTAVFRALHVSSRTQAAIVAAKMGLTESQHKPS